MTLKPTPNGYKKTAKWPKSDHKCGSFDQNEAVFRRNVIDAKVSSLLPVPGTFKDCVNKDLRPILAGSPTSIFRKYKWQLKMRRGEFFGRTRGCITN